MNTHTTNTVISCLGAALLGLGVTLSPLHAQTVTQSVSVASSDLDLSNAAGVATLRHRIVAAVREVCGTVDANSFQDRANYDDCRSAATAGAMAQMRSRVAAVQGAKLLASSAPR